MSFESDSLHAFAAFTTEFKRAGRLLTWGLPIWSSTLHLLWEHEPWDFCDINRRDEFPSWSWAGWSRTAAMNFPLDDPAPKVSCTCAIADELSRSHILICKARSAKVSITGQFPLFTLAGASESSIMLDRGMNVKSDDIPHDCLMMEICQTNGIVLGLLVVKQKDNIFSERIGSGFMKLTDFENAESASHELKLVWIFFTISRFFLALNWMLKVSISSSATNFLTGLCSYQTSITPDGH